MTSLIAIVFMAESLQFLIPPMDYAFGVGFTSPKRILVISRARKRQVRPSKMLRSVQSKTAQGARSGNRSQPTSRRGDAYRFVAVIN